MPEESSPSALSAGHRRWRINILAATWMSYAGYYFCRKVFGIVKTDLAEQYQFTDSELAHIWTSFLVAYMVGQFVSAAVGRQLTCRKLLLAGMAVSLCATAVLGSLTHIGREAMLGLMGFMIVNGLAQATGWPGNVGLLSKWTRRQERGTVMAFWCTCYQIGSILAKHFAAMMLALLGIAWSFWGASLVLFGVWVMFFFLGQDRPESVGLSPLVDEVVPDNEDGSPGAGAKVVRSTAQVFTLVIAMGMIYFCFKFIRYALDSWAPMILAQSFNLKGSTAGHISTTFDWIGFLGVLVGGISSDRLFRSRRTPVIFLMTVGMCMATVGLWLVGDSSLLMFALLLGLIGFMLMGPDALLSGTAAMEVGSREFAVVASGMINGLGSIGPIIQEEAIGYIKGAYGVDMVLLLLVVVAVVAVIGTGLLYGASWRLKLKL